MLRIPKSVLVDKFIYREYIGIGRDKQPTYGEPINIDFVRIDRHTVFSRDTNDARIVAKAVIYCYADHTTPFLPYLERSLIEFDGKEYTITNLITVNHWARNEVWAYELEVI